MEKNYENPTLRDYLKVVFRQKAVIFSVVAAAGLITAIGLKFKTPVYQAQVTMLISAEKQVESPYYRELDAQAKAVFTQSQIVKSNPVIDSTVRALNLQQRPLDYEKNFSSSLKKGFIERKANSLAKRLEALPPALKEAQLFRMAANNLKSRVSVEPIKDTNLFTISVSDYSPVSASIMANTLSRSYLIFDLRQQLAEMQLKYGERHPTVLQLNDNIKNMLANLSGQPLSDIEAMGPASVKVIEQATIPSMAEGLSDRMLFLFSIFLSSLLGVALAFAFDHVDQTFKSTHDIRDYLNLPLLGSIPRTSRENYYHMLGDQLCISMKKNNLRSLSICSAFSGEGTSTTVVNLAVYLSKILRHRVLVIDANFRTPSLHKIFNSSNSYGLSDILEKKISMEEAICDLGGNLNLITAGSSVGNPEKLFNSKYLEEVFTKAKDRYDIALVDASPLNSYKDSYVLSSRIDALALVIDEARTRRQAVREALSHFSLHSNLFVLGVILNKRRFPIPNKIYDII